MENKITYFKNKKNIIVVMRGASAVNFREETNLSILNIQSSIGPVNITYTTRWLKKKDNIVVPGHIWIEVNGSAQSLEEALVPFANASLSILPILSLSAMQPLAIQIWRLVLIIQKALLKETIFNVTFLQKMMRFIVNVTLI